MQNSVGNAEKKPMKTFLSLLYSDDPKSKNCGEPGRTIQKRPRRPKWLGLLIIAFVLVVAGAVAQAQRPGKIPRVGVLTSAPSAELAPWIAAFRQGLRELGYIEGKNIVLEIRSGEGNPGRIAGIAAELVRLKVDVIVAGGPPALRAAMKATSTIPIVMRTAMDPVAVGIAPSLARPGGNVTGVTSITTKLIGKQLELLAEVVPQAKRIAVLTAQSDRAKFMATEEYKEMAAAAQVLGVTLQVLSARDPDTIDDAFVAMTKERAQALLVTPNPRYLQHGKHIIDRAVINRLPAIYYQPIFVEKGGLMSYATDNADEWRRAAVYVDKILKGAKPADLPIEQPMKFELLFNLKAAKQISLTIPPNVLVRANRVIR
jgi:putative ABC transport system substrate-binding protein